MAYLTSDFYYFELKNISPDSFEISGNEKIVLTYYELYTTDFIIEIALMKNNLGRLSINNMIVLMENWK